MSKRAFALVAHPDDIEFMMAGTLILLREAGYELHYMTVANGSCGSMVENAPTIARIRRQESMDAAGLLGAVYHESLCNDLEIFYDKPTLQRLGAVMREVAPDIILTHPPQDYMEDHMNTCRLALTAAFARGVPNFPTQPPRPPVGGPVAIYHALPYGLHDPLGRRVYPGRYVDVTSVLEAKRALLAMHRSQKDWLDATQGIDSYLTHMEEMTREVGRMSGRYAYAEGWTQHLHLGYGPPGADPLAEALGTKLLSP
jgi:LmbE family N-acetylglucosaminyl deacetylase